MSSRRKPCMKCGGVKPAGRARRLCDLCALTQIQEKGKRLRPTHRNAELRRRYGISGAQYEAMSAAQGDVCAICEQAPQTRRVTVLAVDHHHGTGTVRGLLCQRCNMALHFLENPEWRAAAEAYLAAPPAASALTGSVS